jgi:hypothetical protein
MPVTVLHDPIKEKQISCHCPSAATTPIVGTLPIPFSGKLLKVGATVNGAFTSTMSVAVALISNPADGVAPGAGTAVAGSPFTLSGTNSAAGSMNFLVPTANTYVTDGDTLLFTPSGATGATVTANFFANVRMGL